MSALAEALVAAQRRAIAAMEKAYVADRELGGDLTELLDAIGCTDKVEQSQLIAALNVITGLGAASPAEPTNGAEKKPEPATDAQLSLIAGLVTKHHLEAPDLPLTKQDASAIITAMKDGSYDAAKWKVPF